MSLTENVDQVDDEDSPTETVAAGLVAVLDSLAELHEKVDRLAGKVDAFEAEARPVLESMKGTAEKLASGGLMGLFKS